MAALFDAYAPGGGFFPLRGMHSRPPPGHGQPERPPPSLPHGQARPPKPPPPYPDALRELSSRFFQSGDLFVAGVLFMLYLESGDRDLMIMLGAYIYFLSVRSF